MNSTKFERTCQSCKEKIEYTTEVALKRALKRNALHCTKCKKPHEYLPAETDSGWERKCPKCGQRILHTLRSNCQQAIDKKRLCKPCGALKAARPGESNGFFGEKHTDEAKSRVSTARVDRELSMSDEDREKFKITMQDAYEKYHRNVPRQSNYTYWIAKHGIIQADVLMFQFKAKVSKKSSGSLNPMYGKPSPKGSGIGWKGHYKGRFFRSLRELQFMLENPSATSAEGHQFRAKFYWLDKERTTVADFLIEEARLLVECKPERLHNTPLVQAKSAAMADLAKEKGLTFKIVDPGIPTSEKILDLIGSGEVVLLPKSLELFEAWITKQSS